MDNNINFEKWETVKEKQNWEIIWDPDSSPKAWEHYRKYYSVEDWNFLKNYLKNGRFAENSDLRFYNGEDIYTYDKEKKCYKKYKEKGYYKEPVFEEHASLCCPQIELSCKKCNICSSYQSKGGILLRLRGETDFYFRENTPEEKKPDKNKRLKNIIKDSKDVEKQRYAMDLLEKCKNMHYSLLNFSLMQSVGNMQEVKSKGLSLNGKYDKNGIFEWLDRLDTFVYHLDMYYKNRKDDCNIDDSVILSCAGDCKHGNKDCLKDYLDKFGDNPNDKDAVYDYCDKVYFIKIGDAERGENDFIQRLIKSGKKELSSCDEVIEYMELAVEFWKRKQEYFESIKITN